MDTFFQTHITYGFMKSGEEDEVINLILTTFNEFVAPGYSEEGITEFCNYANAKGLKMRSKKITVPWLQNRTRRS